jgi:hypothetical protein
MTALAFKAAWRHVSYPKKGSDQGLSTRTFGVRWFLAWGPSVRCRMLAAPQPLLSRYQQQHTSSSTVPAVTTKMCPDITDLLLGGRISTVEKARSVIYSIFSLLDVSDVCSSCSVVTLGPFHLLDTMNLNCVLDHMAHSLSLLGKLEPNLLPVYPTGTCIFSLISAPFFILSSFTKHFIYASSLYFMHSFCLLYSFSRRRDGTQS